MVGVGGDLCGSSSPTLLPKQDHLQQAVEDLVQVGLEYLQRRRLHNLPGQPVPVLCMQSPAINRSTMVMAWCVEHCPDTQKEGVKTGTQTSILHLLDDISDNWGLYRRRVVSLRGKSSGTQ